MYICQKELVIVKRCHRYIFFLKKCFSPEKGLICWTGPYKTNPPYVHLVTDDDVLLQPLPLLYCTLYLPSNNGRAAYCVSLKDPYRSLVFQDIYTQTMICRYLKGSS